MDDVGLAFGESHVGVQGFDLTSFLQSLPLAGAPVLVSVPAIQRIEGATPGCYALAVSDEYYHRQLEGISASGLKQIMRSPAHYQAWRLGGNPDTPARRFGRAVHCYVLERPTFDARYAVWEEGKRSGNDFKDFAVRHPGKGILTAEEYARVKRCAAALLSDPRFPLRGFLEGVPDGNGGYLVEPARTEFTIVWTDESTGLTCKVRTDAVSLKKPVIGYDVKTTGDARPESFVREMVRLNYDLQAALYCEGIKRFTGEEATFVFGAVEADGGHGVCHYGLGPSHDLMLNGQRKYRYALDLYDKCVKADQWPGYDYPQVVDPQMEPWMTFYAPTIA
jgi:hypothetical protein